jgi:hypothetical protein
MISGRSVTRSPSPSDATPRPTPLPYSRNLSTHDTNANILGGSGASTRRGLHLFGGEKEKGVHRSASNGESAKEREGAASTQSPSKAISSTRTYDPKLVAREMHRLGTSFSSTIGPALANAASVTSLALPAQVSSSAGSMVGTAHGPGQAENPWASLHVHVLPLFVGEPLRIPMCVHSNCLVRTAVANYFI